MSVADSANIDRHTVAGFVQEWAAFNQYELPTDEHQRVFDEFFSEFPWDEIPADAEGFDLGCGPGRWAVLVAPRVGRLHCIDPANVNFACDPCQDTLQQMYASAATATAKLLDDRNHAHALGKEVDPVKRNAHEGSKYAKLVQQFWPGPR